MWKRKRNKIPINKQANVFISSTFIDMQKERDILSRLVFPRLRERFASKFDFISEIDLRWGVTEAMGKHEGAVTICLEEIERCMPLFLGIIGHRTGWIPSLTYLNETIRKSITPKHKLTGLTEIEVSHASNLSLQYKTPPPIILLRSLELTRHVYNELQSDSPDLANPNFQEIADLRKRLSKFQNAVFYDYDSFPEFEALVEEKLATLFTRHIENGYVCIRSAASTQYINRRKLIQQLSKAARKKTTLLYGESGVGKSWLIEQLISNRSSNKCVVIDGRKTNASNFITHLKRQKSLNPYSELEFSKALSELPDGYTVVIDHFEEAFPTEARSDLTLLPSIHKNGVELIVITRSKRLFEQAETLGWKYIRVPHPERNMIEIFVEQYLHRYGKQLTHTQKEQLLSAEWASKLGPLLLALDELRRFGEMERLNERILQLAACSTDKELAHVVLDGIISVLPSQWKTAPRKALSVLANSLNGLEEEALLKVLAGNGDAMSHSMWCAIRLSLGSAFRTRGLVVELADGPLLNIVAENPDLEVLQRYKKIVQTSSDKQWFQELPGLCYRLGGPEELASLLRDVETMLKLINVGLTFAYSWMDKLPKPLKEKVGNSWVKHFELTDQISVKDKTLFLAQTAAACSLNNVAIQLLEIDEDEEFQPDQIDQTDLVDRLLLKAFLTRDTESIHALYTDLCNKLEKDEIDLISDSVIISVLGFIADGSLQLSDDSYSGLSYALPQIRSPRFTPQTVAQASLFLGQIAMNRGNWKSAKNNFDIAQSSSRTIGHARLLCSALERLSAVELEMNHFRKAEKLARECLSLSNSLGLFSYEALAFERLIERASRRTEWSQSYELIDAYFKRCNETSHSTTGPQRMLDSLEDM